MKGIIKTDYADMIGYFQSAVFYGLIDDLASLVIAAEDSINFFAGF